MSCHVVLKVGEDADVALSVLSCLMSEKYGIEHTTIQIEFENWEARSKLTHCN
jgi:Co/Zn/Cd efflux system component